MISCNFLCRPSRFLPDLLLQMKKNRVWQITTLICAILQTLFCLTMIFGVFSQYSIKRPSIPLILFMCFCPLIVLLFDFLLLKPYDRRMTMLEQRRLRLHFNTKLGMHSPKWKTLLFLYGVDLFPSDEYKAFFCD